MPVSGPTLVRRQLGRRLQRLREAAGKSADDVAAARLASRTKIWRIERGQVPVKVADVWAFCRFYNASEAEMDALANLARGTAEHGAWEDYADVVPDWFKLYVGLEATAARIRTFEESVIPGELQIADYARAIYRAERPTEGHEAIERHVKVRLERQRALFTRKSAPEITVVLGQNVFTRTVGGADVLAAQVKHLHELNQRDDVEIRVLPFEAGAHAAMAGAFRILDFDNREDPDIVYLETLLGSRYLEKPAEIDAYRRLFELIYAQAGPI